MRAPVQTANPAILQLSVMIQTISSPLVQLRTLAATERGGWKHDFEPFSVRHCRGMPRRFVSRFVVIEARNTALMELWIGDPSALLLHPRSPKGGICPQQLLVLFALDYVLP